MSDGKAILEVGGAEMHGWTQVLVSRAITQACSAFQVSLNDSDDLRLHVDPGVSCRVTFEGERLLTGYIDAVEVTYTADSHDIAISGRSATADIVDSWIDPVQYMGLSVQEIIRRIARQFDVSLSIEGDATGVQLSSNGFSVVPDQDSVVPDQDFAVSADRGIAFDAVQDAAGRAGWYISDTPDGGLVMARTAGTVTRNEIVVIPGQTVNVLGASYRNDQSSRYSTYRVIGQNESTDMAFGLETAQVIGEVTDPDIGRNRLRVITAETGLTTVQAQARAIQERQAAIATSFGVEYVVQGWRGSANEVWRENRIINVRDDIIGIRRQLLIDTVNYIQDINGGTTCRLSLVLPEARMAADSSTAGVVEMPR